jgi:DICT domain-containing protein
VAARAGVSAATLRMWEARHGFPEPERSDRGHRRYHAHELERVQRVAADRRAGLPLALAIRRAREEEPFGDVSVFSELRRRHPELEARTLSRRAMVALSTAIEDECLARAERPLLCAAFQRERFYREVELRWRELARTAEASFVFADFNRLRRPRRGPVQVPLRPASPMMREWLLVCWDQRMAACLVGWELPARRRGADRARRFEAVWTIDPAVVRSAALMCARRLRTAGSEFGLAAERRIESLTGPSGAEQLRAASALTARALSGLT